MALVLEINQTEITSNKRLVASRLRCIAAIVGREIKQNKGTLSLVLVPPAKIKKINQAYRGKNSVTDVLAFSYVKDKIAPSVSIPFVKGEIVICLDQAKRQATVLGTPFKKEVARLIIHGILHIFGYDHKQPAAAKRMFTLTNKILAKI